MRRLCIISLLAALSVIVLLIFRISMLAERSTVALLIADGHAQWICVDEPVDLQARPPSNRIAQFRTTFVLDQPPAHALLTVRSFRLSAVRLNGVEVLPPGDDLSQWKVARQVDIAPLLKRGENLLEIEGFNQNAPVAVLAHCQPINLVTNQAWLAAHPQEQWKPARAVDHPRLPAIARQFPAAEVALVRSMPVLLVAAVLAIVLLWAPDRPLQNIRSLVLNPDRLRWWLLALLVIVGANNAAKLPPDIGFDVHGHLAYILHIIEYKSIPLATDGWQMFQSPLYYLVSAPLALVGLQVTDVAGLAKLLRIVPLLCCATQVLVLHRVMRLSFPARADSQLVGIVAGALLPMNLYMSHFIGNEPLAGLLTSIVICMLLAYGVGEARDRALLRIVLLGATFGLAALTKVTPLLLTPVIVLWLAGAQWARGGSITRGVRDAGLVVGVAAVVSGWYYLRNWLLLGQPFVGGWDPSRGITWWQDPGYRTIDDLLRFGTSMRWPIYAAAIGFWDALYSTIWTDGMLSGMVTITSRPRWNVNLLVSLAPMALVPGLLLLAGVGRWIACALKGLQHCGSASVPENAASARALVLAIMCIGVYLAAMLDLFLRLPIYSTAKGTYMLGLLPCFGILVAAGFEWLSQWRFVRAGLIILLSAWAFSAYLTFFVL